ncbi:MAG: purine-nucleoside phosphorylase, partial [Actinobacteria bacterium]|nr:purine-nucleoside phosphorylase [Actinomycetota bacterium]NIU21631.1 purine-nucleoside phosphorylase [Actinomycetota bacterium]NIV58170.1 purine-nucleoside phosphorylase [Actinomycetota bacterium]NIX52970.1 purine-nucleoside phosphorylase [Actinomycetota bacterium]
MNRTRYNGWDFAATADFHLARAAVDAAAAKGIEVHVGNV